MQKYCGRFSKNLKGINIDYLRLLRDSLVCPLIKDKIFESEAYAASPPPT